MVSEDNIHNIPCLMSVTQLQDYSGRTPGSYRLFMRGRGQRYQGLLINYLNKLGLSCAKLRASEASYPLPMAAY